MRKQSDFIMKPKVDFCFKELMASAAVRQGFISAVLGIKPEEVVQTELLPTHLETGHREDKLGILDVRVVLNGDAQIDMEIQVEQFRFWPERSIFYLSKMYVEQILLFDTDGEFYSRFHLWEDRRRRMYSDKLEIHIIELPKLARHEYPETALLKWAKFICAEKKEEFEMVAKTDPYIEEAYEQLLYISADEKKRLEYEARQKAIWDHNCLMKSNWEDGYAQGAEDGYAQGAEDGERKGEIKGEIKGITIGAEKKLVVLVCKKIKKGCSVPEIADMLEEEESAIQEIYDAALEFAPDYDTDKIMERINGKRLQRQAGMKDQEQQRFTAK